MLLQLPGDIVYLVISEWLRGIDLGYVDTACAYGGNRRILHDQFARLSDFPLDGLSASSSLYNWCFYRNIRIRTLILHDELTFGDLLSSDIYLNCRMNYSFVTNIFIPSSERPALMSNIFNSCVNLKSFECVDCECVLQLNGSILENLEHFSYIGLDCDKVMLKISTHCCSLRKLRIVDGATVYTNLYHFGLRDLICRNHSLRSLNVVSAIVVLQDIQLNCKSIEAIAIYCQPLSSFEIIADFIKNCSSTLYSLDVRSEDLFLDYSAPKDNEIYLKVINNSMDRIDYLCSVVKVVHIELHSVTGFDIHCITSLVQKSKNSLQSVMFTENVELEADAIIELLTHCKKLEYLGITSSTLNETKLKSIFTDAQVKHRLRLLAIGYKGMTIDVCYKLIKCCWRTVREYIFTHIEATDTDIAVWTDKFSKNHQRSRMTCLSSVLLEVSISGTDGTDKSVKELLYSCCGHTDRVIDKNQFPRSDLRKLMDIYDAMCTKI